MSALVDEGQETIDRANRRIAALERRPPHRAFAIGMGLGAGLSLVATGLGIWAAH